MELKLWQIILALVAIFDVAFILGCMWGSREKDFSGGISSTQHMQIHNNRAIAKRIMENGL